MPNLFTNLAGDRGFPLKQCLLTPFSNPQSAEERNYIGRHVVERTIGPFKETRKGRPHNVAQLWNVPLPPDAVGCVGLYPDPYPEAPDPDP